MDKDAFDFMVENPACEALPPRLRICANCRYWREPFGPMWTPLANGDWCRTGVCIRSRLRGAPPGLRLVLSGDACHCGYEDPYFRASLAALKSSGKLDETRSFARYYRAGIARRRMENRAIDEEQARCEAAWGKYADALRARRQGPRIASRFPDIDAAAIGAETDQQQAAISRVVAKAAHALAAITSTEKDCH